VAILSAASRYRNWLKLQSRGPPWLVRDLTLTCSAVNGGGEGVLPLKVANNEIVMLVTSEQGLLGWAPLRAFLHAKMPVSEHN